MKRTLALILALFLLTPAIIACTKNDDIPDGTDASETTAPEETAETGRASLKDNLPADFTLSGDTVTVITRDTYRTFDWDGGESKDSDVLAQAVFNRTRAVEARLSATFDVTEIAGGDWQTYGKDLEQLLLAGEEYDIALAASNASIRPGNDYLFQDMSKNPYLDFDQPWWSRDAMEAISLDGKKIRYLVGDIAINSYFWATATFFNKNLYEDKFGSADDLYKLAIDGNWTYDKLLELTEAGHNDVDGNGTLEVTDIYGFLVDVSSRFYFMDHSTDLDRLVRGENGVPVVQYDIDRASAILEKFLKLVYDTPGSFYNTNLHKTHPNLFTDGHVMFMFAQLYNTSLPEYRGMQNDYGILPMPKIDEQQTEYRSFITDSATYVTVPITCSRPDVIGGVLEALCSESHRNVREVFYEIALKSKYSRDSYSGQVIDIIMANTTKSFLYEYDSVVGGGNWFRYCLMNNSNAFASKYNAEVGMVNQLLSALVEKYNKLESEMAG